jgi:peptidoglycan LD-endopeptidase LytH
MGPWGGRLPAIQLLVAALSTASLAACLPVPVRTEPRPETETRPAPSTPGTPSSSTSPSEPLPPEAALAAKGLIIPVEGVDPSRVRDSYTAARGGRTHDAVDIMAPKGTPVIAADAGTILRLRQNDAGGITIYQLDPDERFIYYYAHLDRYETGLVEGKTIRQGDVLGFVGTTGNAPKDTPHLHFQVMIYRGRGQYWGGEPINPHPYMTKAGRRE